MPENACPAVSVITPAYNAESTLRQAIESVLNQTFSNLELILVDDGSTDGTGAICDEYAAADPRVNVIHQKNGGVAVARNTGLDSVRGEYICWLDSDDFLFPEMLETLMEVAGRTKIELVMCNYTSILEDGSEVLRYKSYDRETVLDRETAVGWVFQRKLAPALWASILRKELFEDLRFEPGVVFEDVRNVYKLFERSNGVVFIPKALMSHRILANSISHQKNLVNWLDGCEAVIARYEDAAPRWPQFARLLLNTSARVSLKKLREQVLCNPANTYRDNARRISGICRFYRRHSKEIELPNWKYRVPYWLTTLGTRWGFRLSMKIDPLMPEVNRDLRYLRFVQRDRP